MKIRRAEKKDIPRINDLLTQVNLVHHNGRPDIFKRGRKYTDTQLLELISDDSRPIFVAVDSDGIVQGYAFCVFVEHPNDNILTDIKTLYIDDLCVDELARGQHIGSLLFDYVTEFARESCCYNVTLNVWDCNPSAMKFYESCGLKQQKTGMEKII